MSNLLGLHTTPLGRRFNRDPNGPGNELDDQSACGPESPAQVLAGALTEVAEGPMSSVVPRRAAAAGLERLYQFLYRLFNSNVHDDPEKPTVLLCAPTGKAAFNITGHTIHADFKLPYNQTTFHHLSSDVANTMSNKYSRLRLIVIDEISMVGQKELDMIHQRLRHCFDPDKPFGGISIITCGDFFQLPPVMSRSLINDLPWFVVGD